MDRKTLMVAALAAAGENAVFTPVQVQKLFFLLDREAAHLLGGKSFDFEPYDYGPFDRAVYNELDLLELGGLVQIGSSGSYRRYSLTPAGFAAGITALRTLPAETERFIQETANWVRRLNFRQLVAAIYRKYPDMKVNSIFSQ